MTLALERDKSLSALPNPGRMSTAEFSTLLTSEAMFKDALRGEEWVLDLLWELNDHHPDTVRHSARVGYNNGVMSEGSLSERNRRVLQGLTHDTRKRFVPVLILDKPGHLDPEEKGVVKGHVYYSIDDPVMRHRPDVAAGNVGHHLFQPDPYPEHLIGASVPSDVHEDRQRLAASDQADALLSRRAYKEPWSPDKTRAVLNGDGHLPQRLVNMAVDLRAGMPNLELPARNVIYLVPRTRKGKAIIVS